MQAKLFFGKIRVRIGEYENTVSLLIVANSRESGWDVLEEAAQQYYGDEDTPEEDGGYYANGGEVFVAAQSLEEIGLGTFIELKPLLTVRRAYNAVVPDETAFEAPVSELAQALTRALNRKSPTVTHSQVLNAIASAYGQKNWHVLKLRLEQAAPEAKPSSEAPLAPTELIAQHQQWVATERLRVGLDKISFIEGHGYRLTEDGPGTGWYAFMPGTDDVRYTNYLGVYESLDRLVAELLRRMDYLPDEVAIGLCKLHNLQILKHKTPVLNSRWFWVGSQGSFATAGDAARDVLRVHGIRHSMLPARVDDSVNARRREVAGMMFEAYEFESPVEAVNGWEDTGEVIQRAVFLEQDNGQPSKKVLFQVSFKNGSAEPDNWSVK